MCVESQFIEVPLSCECACFRLSLSWLRRRMLTVWWGLGDTCMAGAWKATRRHPLWAHSHPLMKCDSRCTCCWKRHSAWLQGGSPHPEGTPITTTHLLTTTALHRLPSPMQMWWPALRAQWAVDGEACSGYHLTVQTCINAACPNRWAGWDYLPSLKSCVRLYVTLNAFHYLFKAFHFTQLPEMAMGSPPPLPPRTGPPPGTSLRRYGGIGLTRTHRQMQADTYIHTVSVASRSPSDIPHLFTFKFIFRD